MGSPRSPRWSPKHRSPETLADAGSALFPTLDPVFHAAAAALVHAHPDNTAYVQETLNFINATGYIKLDAPLVVDGSWGPKTKAAVMVLQAKLHVPATGFFVDAEYSALSVLVSKFSGANINTALAAIVPPGAAAAVAAQAAAAPTPAAAKP